MSRNKSVTYAHISLLVVNLVYGANYSIAKGLMPDIVQPSGFILIRVLGATSLFWLAKTAFKEIPRKADIYKFAIAGNSFVYPIAAYSNRIKSIDELKVGAKIAIPSDPTNLARALMLLEQQGLLKLKEGADLSATVLDIVSNPKKFEIIELEAPQLPRSLDDVSLAIINTTYASSINLSPEKDGIFVEDKDSPYVNLIVAREDNVTSENVQKFVKAYQSEAVYQAAMKTFKNGVVKGW